MNIKKLIKEEIVKVLKTLNEAPISDPILKKLRTQIPGEKFPELKTWWEYEPEDIMTYVYWHQGKLPPTGTQFEKEWQNIVKQLHRNYPIPSEELDRVLPKMDLDDRTEREISVDAPDRYGEAKDQYKPTYGTGDVVHDCPKHVQETISGKKGKVVAHSLNEIGEVNYVDVDFGTGKVYHDIPTKKLKILEGRTHEHAVKAEPNLKEADVFGGGEDSATTDTSGDTEKDIQKLAKKFEGPLEPIIKLINTKDELAQAVELIISKAEENKPGLGSKAKPLLKSTINDL
jgi:hypothetical protein